MESHKVINEHNLQRDEDRVDVQAGYPSFASLRLDCHRVGNSRIQAQMRVYLQVPYTNTELDYSQQRRQQAAQWQPHELWAFKKIMADPVVSKFTPQLLGVEETTQADDGLVPGGFYITIVWQRVPGEPLGDISTIPKPLFWKLDRPERNEIRAQFKEKHQ